MEKRCPRPLIEPHRDSGSWRNTSEERDISGVMGLIST